MGYLFFLIDVRAAPSAFPDRAASLMLTGPLVIFPHNLQQSGIRRNSL